MSAGLLVDALAGAGVTLAASLPDSWLGPLLDAIDRDARVRHIHVAREDEGVALVAGAALAGERGVVVCQNAGLLLSTNALAGYGLHHALPVPVLAAHRGGRDDSFYYQAYKARTIRAVLDAIDMPHFAVEVPDRLEDAAAVVDLAWLHRRPAVCLLTRAALTGAGT